MASTSQRERIYKYPIFEGFQGNHIVSATISTFPRLHHSLKFLTQNYTHFGEGDLTLQSEACFWQLFAVGHHARYPEVGVVAANE